MRTFFLLITFCIITTAGSQSTHQQFIVVIENKSAFTTTYTIPGNEKLDSVLPGKKKITTFRLEWGQLSFNLSLWTQDPSPKSYHYFSSRVLNVAGKKEIKIRSDGSLVYAFSDMEKVIAKVNPQLRTLNFFKLDTAITRNANNIAGAEIVYLSLCDSDVPVDTIKYYFNLLSPAIRKGPFGNRISEYLLARDRLLTGKLFNDFILPDTSGARKRLADFHSDYILVDFWFSRCVPCIQAIPAMKELYSNTTRNRLEIIGISVDVPKEHTLWITTVRDHSLPWVNLNDADFRLAHYLAIVNFPTRFLLDKDRRIVFLDPNNGIQDFYQQVEKIINH